MTDSSSETGVVKRKVGRPQKFSPTQLTTINNELSEYIDKVDDPTMAGFIATHDWHLTKEFLSDRKEFSDSIKRLINKQEAFLTSQMKNPTMAIFRLKQPIFGYSDRTEVTNTNVNINVKADMTVNKDFTAFLKQKTIQQ